MTSPDTNAETAKAVIKEVLDTQPEFDSLETFEARRKLLSAYSILSAGRNVESEAMPQVAINGGFKQRQLSVQQQMDRIEVRAGYQPRRHEWMQAVERQDLFVEFLRRMDTLQMEDERDIELEQATVEIASLYLMGGDENGNMMLTYRHVSSDEVYESKRAKEGSALQSPELRENIAGFPLNCAFFTYGEWVGFTDENAQRWFVMEGQDLLAPLDMITEISSAWDDKMRLKGVEYKPERLVRT